jgi:hypothetical protein
LRAQKGRTALIYAVIWDNTAAFAGLLARGADRKVLDKVQRM